MGRQNGPVRGRQPTGAIVGGYEEEQGEGLSFAHPGAEHD